MIETGFLRAAARHLVLKERGRVTDLGLVTAALLGREALKSTHYCA
jgi:hypothetical protein